MTHLSPRETKGLYGSLWLADRAELQRRLMVEALPYARRELAKIRERVTDEPGMLHNIQSDLVSRAMRRGETIEQVACEKWIGRVA